MRSSPPPPHVDSSQSNNSLLPLCSFLFNHLPPLPSFSSQPPTTNMSKYSLLLLTTLVFLLPTPSFSATETFVFGGCSQQKFTPGSPYESNLNSLLTSLVNSASFSIYNNFTVQSQTSSYDTVSGLFQCRGDLSVSDCQRCVSRAVSQLGTSLCLDSCGGVIQLEGCFVKYDNVSFLGVEDKTVVIKKCGPSVGDNSNALYNRDGVLNYLGANDGSFRPYRVASSNGVYGFAQCVQDLSGSECQDCVSEAIGRMKTDCGDVWWGDMYLAKCYVRYSVGGSHSNDNHDHNHDDDEIEKTLAILIGLIAGVALLILFLTFLSKAGKGKGGK